jgi:PAS domain-containing protein
MMVSANTKSQLIAENTALRARIAKLEAAIADGLHERGEPVENDRAKGAPRMDELKESENRYRRLFETAQDGILILDARTGKIEDANPFLENLVGYTQAELHRNEKELQSLYDMNELLQSCNSQDEAYQVIRMLGSELFGDQSGSLSILRHADRSDLSSFLSTCSNRLLLYTFDGAR